MEEKNYLELVKGENYEIETFGSDYVRLSGTSDFYDDNILDIINLLNEEGVDYTYGYIVDEPGIDEVLFEIWNNRNELEEYLKDNDLVDSCNIEERLEFKY